MAVFSFIHGLDSFRGLVFFFFMLLLSFLRAFLELCLRVFAIGVIRSPLFRRDYTGFFWVRLSCILRVEFSGGVGSARSLCLAGFVIL